MEKEGIYIIELAFGDSPAGALKLAKSMKQGEHLTGTIGVIGGTKQERRAARKPRWSGMTMEGKTKQQKGNEIDVCKIIYSFFLIS